jgi:predicted TIM-barrel fold metal-dependent hydrolase
MLIDADCHISSHKFDNLAITADELIEQMDRAGIDKSIVWLKPPYDKNIDPENRAIYDAMRKYPGRLLGFGWANPNLGKDRTRDTIKQCFEEYGFYGIKFNGAQDGYVIDDLKVLPHIEEAAKYGKMLAFHIGADFYENTHPYRLGNIASQLPQTQFFMIHMGGAGTPPLSRSAIETAQKYNNITIIGSAIPFGAVLQAIETLGTERVCFGSDTPFQIMHVCLAAYRALMRDIDEAGQSQVLGGNVVRLLGLE